MICLCWSILVREPALIPLSQLSQLSLYLFFFCNFLWPFNSYGENSIFSLVIEKMKKSTICWSIFWNSSIFLIHEKCTLKFIFTWRNIFQWSFVVFPWPELWAQTFSLYGFNFSKLNLLLASLYKSIMKIQFPWQCWICYAFWGSLQ